MDTRYTTEPKFIENVTAVYSDLYMKVRNSQPCFREFGLVVEDMCRFKALETQNLVSINFHIPVKINEL